jgi:hypothetical protein
MLFSLLQEVHSKAKAGRNVNIAATDELDGN